MATLIGEMRGREYDATNDGDTATRVFKVQASDKTEDGPDAIVAVGIAYGSSHPKNSFIYALDFNAVQDDEAWWLWIVTVSYRRPEKEEEEDPLDQRPSITYDTEEIAVASIAGIDDSGALVPHVNSAGDPIDPPLEDEISILVINIERKENADISVSRFFDYNNCVNSNAFTFGDVSIPAGKALLRIRAGARIDHQNQDGTEIQYRSVQYTLRINTNGWDHRPLDEGPNYIDGSDKKRFMTADDPPQPRIGLLDGSGGALGSGASEVFLTIQRKRRRDFSVLQLPTGP